MDDNDVIFDDQESCEGAVISRADELSAQVEKNSDGKTSTDVHSSVTTKNTITLKMVMDPMKKP